MFEKQVKYSIINIQIYDQKLAVSFGASTITESGGSFKKAIEESDAEMYRNKQEHKKRR